MSNEPKKPEFTLTEILEGLKHEDFLWRVNETTYDLMQQFSNFNEEESLQVIRALLQKLERPTSCGYPTIHDTIRERMVWTLGKIGEKAAIPEVLKAFTEILENTNNQETTLKPAVITALAQMGKAAANPKIIDALFKLLPDGDVSKALGAVCTTDNMRETMQKMLLQELLGPKYDSKPSSVFTDAANVLTPMENTVSEEILPLLLEKLLDQKTTREVRQRVLLIFRAMKDAIDEPKVLHTLLNILQNPSNKHEHQSVINAFGNMGPALLTSSNHPEILRVIINNLSDQEVENATRIASAEALGEIGNTSNPPESILQALTTVLNNKKEPPHMHMYVLSALENIGENAATPMLITTLVGLLKEKELDRNIHASALDTLQSMLKGRNIVDQHYNEIVPTLISVLDGNSNDRYSRRCLKIAEMLAAVGKNSSNPQAVVESLTPPLMTWTDPIKITTILYALAWIEETKIIPEKDGVWENVRNAIGRIEKITPKVFNPKDGRLYYSLPTIEEKSKIVRNFIHEMLPATEDKPLPGIDPIPELELGY